jgi:Helix-turn-helix domain
MVSIPAARRPHYEPTQRLAILELRAARCWSLAQTAKVFQVTAATIASWGKRLDEDGIDALLRSAEPVNKYPDFIRSIVQRLQCLCPSLGKVKIAQILARAGLHLAATTIGRVRREPPISAASRRNPAFRAARHREASQSRLACRFDRRADFRRLLGFLVCLSRCRSVGHFAGGSRWSLTTIPEERWASPSSNGSRLHNKSVSSSAESLPTSELRPNILSPILEPSLLVQVPILVSAARHSAPQGRRRSDREHCRR